MGDVLHDCHVLTDTCRGTTTRTLAVVRPRSSSQQITGGIGYTDVYPIERAVRDTRLAQIWTGTNEVMSTMIQHDLYQEFHASRGSRRDFERDAMHADDSEKIFDDDDMWKVYDEEK